MADDVRIDYLRLGERNHELQSENRELQEKVKRALTILKQLDAKVDLDTRLTHAGVNVGYVRGLIGQARSALSGKRE